MSIRNNVYYPEIRQQYEDRLAWAEKALQETGDELYENHRRIEQTLKETKAALVNYRPCTCGSGYIWPNCSGHPETGTMYCG